MPVIHCVCGYRMEGADDGALFRAMRIHSDQAHADLQITDQSIRDILTARSRMTTWDGGRTSLASLPEIRALGPERLDDFLRFFDRDAFMDNPIWASCYCFYHHFGGTDAEWDQRSGARNREEKSALIRSGQAQGLLAYVDGRPVGWCHAAPRLSLPALDRSLEFRVDDAERVGSIVCFVIAAPYRRQGVARRLLDAACKRLRRQGFEYAEAYPLKHPMSDARACQGPFAMYLAAGFSPYRESERRAVVRKPLSPAAAR